jgi:hypothetical protein
MKHPIKLLLLLLAGFLLVSSACNASDNPGAISAHAASPFGSIFLLPGDSKSIDLSYDGLLLESASYNICLVNAAIADDQIHQMRVDFTPREDAGASIGYFTIGAFFYARDGQFKFLEFLEPRLSYGSQPASYNVDAYPAISLGFIFSAVVIEYQDFNFPFSMTLTVTLSK